MIINTDIIYRQLLRIFCHLNKAEAVFTINFTTLLCVQSTIAELVQEVVLPVNESELKQKQPRPRVMLLADSWGNFFFH